MAENFLDAFVRFGDGIESPTPYIEWSAIVGVAAMLNRKCWIPSGPNGVHPCLYCFFIGPIGIGKDQAAGLMKDLLVEQVWPEQLGVEVASKSRFYQLLKNREITAEMIDEAGLLTNYSYSPSLIVSSELESITSVEDDFFCCLIDLWSKRKFPYETVAHGTILIERPGICFIGNTNPDSFEKFLRSGHISQGMGRRFIAIYCTKRSRIYAFQKDYSEPDKQEEAYSLRLKMKAMIKYKGPFIMTNEWQNLVIENNHENVKNAEKGNYPDEHRRAYFTDRKIFLMKLGMVLCACRETAHIENMDDLEKFDPPKIITDEDYFKADELLIQTENGLTELYRVSAVNADIKWENKVMKMLVTGGRPRSEIAKRLGTDLDIQVIERILGSLAAKGMITMDPTGVIYKVAGE